MDDLTLRPVSPADLDVWAARWAEWSPHNARTLQQLSERDRVRQPHDWGERWTVCAAEAARGPLGPDPLELGSLELGLLELESPRLEN